jgi:hypothetical protein
VWMLRAGRYGTGRDGSGVGRPEGHAGVLNADRFDVATDRRFVAGEVGEQMDKRFEPCFVGDDNAEDHEWSVVLSWRVTSAGWLKSSLHEAGAHRRLVGGVTRALVAKQ